MYKIGWALLVVTLLSFTLINVSASAEEDSGTTAIRQDMLKIATRKDMLEIAKQLRPPGCLHSMTADFCTLSTAYDLRTEISGLLAQGKDKEQVIEELVQKYGNRILAAPKAEGFHWLVWILPGIGIGAGSITVGLLVYAWVRRTRTSDQMIPSVITVSSEQEKHIQEELKKWL